MKIDCVTGAFDTDTGKLVCVQSAKYSEVELCFAESMNIPFAKIKLHDRDRYVDAQAVFKDAVRLGEEIERRWNEFPALEEENRRLTEVMVTGVTPDNVNGGMVLGLEGGMLQVMADCFAETFKGRGAKNFLSMDFTDKDGDSYTVTMQKADGETPAEKNARLEHEVETLKGNISRLRATITMYRKIITHVAAIAHCGATAGRSELELWIAVRRLTRGFFAIPAENKKMKQRVTDAIEAGRQRKGGSDEN